MMRLQSGRSLLAAFALLGVLWLTETPVPLEEIELIDWGGSD